MNVAGTVLLAVNALVTRKPTPDAITIELASARRPKARAGDICAGPHHWLATTVRL